MLPPCNLSLQSRPTLPLTSCPYSELGEDLRFNLSKTTEFYASTLFLQVSISDQASRSPLYLSKIDQQILSVLPLKESLSSDGGRVRDSWTNIGWPSGSPAEEREEGL